MTLAENTQLSSLEAREVVAPLGRAPLASDIEAQYAKLSGIKDTAFVGDLCFGDVACFYMARVPRFLARFRELEPRFPEGVRPQGYVFSVVDDWDTDGASSAVHLHAKTGDRSVRVLGRLGQFGNQQTPGPFLFLGQIGKVSATGRYEVIAGALHPIISKGLIMPVDSDLERQVARVLLQQIDYWENRQALSARLHKPLFDEQLGDGTWVRPDFELHLPDESRVIVEVMGYEEDEDYRARKTVLVESLSAEPDVRRVVSWSPQSDETVMRRLLTGIAMSSSAPA